ncbi:MAG: hypothetical protein BAA01_10830 [Bacillus thermozeamaize]|uniref:DUF4352 domain-containing protein n=1 Tax=Bacillus thermozeamaize TaxID=230954 RepID=A0A1Y3PKP3_9BACI|nr:MAG: hypothetical protein BAA01_10830 [Bacillus thermozeamaize]
MMHVKKCLAGLLIGLLAVFLVGCGETVTPEKVDSNTSSQEKEDANPTAQDAENQKPPAPQTFAVGEQIKMGDLIFVVNSVRDSEGDQFIKPQQGHVYKMVDVTLENVGNESDVISSLMMFSLSDADGYKYNVTIGPETKGSLDGELQPGRKMRGELTFEVPKDAKGLELLFEPNVFGFGQAIVKLH